MARPVHLERVADATSMVAALGTEEPWGAVISDWMLPSFSGMAALALLRERGMDVPFIIVSDTVGEEAAVEAMRAGVHDFVRKDRLGRLVPAIDRELEEHAARARHRQATLDLENMNVELKRLEESLRQAIAVRDEFLSIASHELKTPLNSMKLHVANLLRHQRDPESLASQLKVIDRQTERLTRLVSELLDVSLLTGNRLHLDPEELDLEELARDVASRFGLEIGRSGSELQIRSSGPTRGLWDRERLDQVLTNLLSNALKFGGGQPIEVLVEPTASGARISVRDGGLGIDPASHARIFERFERAVSVRHFGGFGLGLWIARQIVEACGGTIAVESESGKGSKFVVELPSTPRGAAQERGS